MSFSRSDGICILAVLPAPLSCLWRPAMMGTALLSFSCSPLVPGPGSRFDVLHMPTFLNQERHEVSCLRLRSRAFWLFSRSGRLLWFSASVRVWFGLHHLRRSWSWWTSVSWVMWRLHPVSWVSWQAVGWYSPGAVSLPFVCHHHPPLMFFYLLLTRNPSRNQLTLTSDGLHPSVEGRGKVALSSNVDLKRTNMAAYIW